MAKKVLPACAGVILPARLDIQSLRCFTRMRGGDPARVSGNGRVSGVLPACAGVIPMWIGPSRRLTSFTRMRGGDPARDLRRPTACRFYPHARG